MQRSLNDILLEIARIKPFLVRNYKVSDIEIFGSYVKNMQNRNSDLDILISFSENPGLLKYMELKNYLTDTLMIKIDLVMKDSLKAELKGTIIREAIAV